MKSTSISVSNNRESGIDIIRCCAVTLVILGHSLILYSPLMHSRVGDCSTFIQGTIAQFCMIGVPLFVLLTGYLNSTKELTKEYFKKIIPVLLAYLLYSILAILFRIFYQSENLTLIDSLKHIFAFSAIPYAWYVEMWIGLFLITPFLNILYKNLAFRKNKLALIAILTVCTIIPHWLNRDGIHIWPGFWAECWPICFYFIGAYIKEFQPRLPEWGWTLIIPLCLVNPAINCFLGTERLVLYCGGPYDVLSLIISVVFFLSIYKDTVKKHPIAHGLSRAAGLVLNVFLGSWLFDQLFLPICKNQSSAGFFYYLHALAVLAASLLLAVIMNVIQKRIRA